MTINIFIEFSDKNWTQRARGQENLRCIGYSTIVAGLYFKRYIEHAWSFVKSADLVPNMIGKSQINRRVYDDSAYTDR